MPVSAYKATGLVVENGTPLMAHICKTTGAADAVDAARKIEASCYIGGHLVVMCSATTNARMSLINELGIEDFPDAVFGTLYAEEGRNGGYTELSDIF